MRVRRRNGVRGSGGVSGRAIDFLGYCFTREATRLRKSIKQRFARKVKRIKNNDRRKEVLASYYGWCKWGDCRNLWRTITDNDMSFADKGIRASDNRYFEVPTESIGNIVNVPITVIDFCSGVKTVQGRDRVCVLFETGGRTAKFITNSSSIKEVLFKAREEESEGNPVFPVENVIIRRRQLQNGKCVFYFQE